MKLVRYGRAGKEKPGLIDSAGKLRDLSETIGDIDGSALGPRALARLAVRPNSLPAVRGAPRDWTLRGQRRPLDRRRPQLRRPCRGSGTPVPKEPVLFPRRLSASSAPTTTSSFPRARSRRTGRSSWRSSSARATSYVSEVARSRHVAGFCLCHDVSERESSSRRSRQWIKGKGCPTFGPLGPWLVTPDEIPDVQKLDLWLDVNGQRMQTGSTATMIFGVGSSVSYICSSSFWSPATSLPPAPRPWLRQEADPNLPEGRRHRCRSASTASVGRRSAWSPTRPNDRPFVKALRSWTGLVFAAVYALALALALPRLSPDGRERGLRTCRSRSPPCPLRSRCCWLNSSS